MSAATPRGEPASAPPRLSTAERALCFGLPAAVMVVAYVAVCLQAGTPWPWMSVVHEDGHRTLLETTFYFEHATRELLLDAVLALAVAGAVRHYYPLPPSRDGPGLARTRLRWAACAAAVLATILVGTAIVDGVPAIVENLAQYHTREGAPLVWGAHWRYHFVERFAEIVLAFGVAGVIGWREGRPAAAPGSRASSLYVAALIAFIGATLIFRPSAEPFRDPTFLGHQLRELLTHTLVTLPLAVGTCLALARRFATDAREGGPMPRRWPVCAALALGFACGVFLLIGSVLGNARSHGQKAGLAELLFPHFFEHSLGYALVASLAALFYLWPSRR